MFLPGVICELAYTNIPKDGSILLFFSDYPNYHFKFLFAPKSKTKRFSEFYFYFNRDFRSNLARVC